MCIRDRANRCAYLPLALRIAAERAVAHPHITLADLTGELAVEHDRLDLLAADDEEDEATVMPRLLHFLLSWVGMTVAEAAGT